MDINDIKRELTEIKENPELLTTLDSELEKILKEIIKIERRHLYGLDSTSASKRKDAIKEFLTNSLKNKGY